MTRPARLFRFAAIGLAGLVLALGLAAGILLATFNPNAYKPRIVAAIRNAIGRDITLNGPIGFSLLPPLVTLRDVAVANPPDFATPHMATLRAITLRVDLGALLHGRLLIRQLLLEAPNVALERNAAGVPNWEFTPSAPEAAPPSAASPKPGTPAARLAVLDARVLAGSLAYRDDRAGREFAVSIPRLAMEAASVTSPVHVSGEIGLGASRLSFTAETGPVGHPFPMRADARLDGDQSATFSIVAQSPASMHVAAQSAGASLTANAEIAAAGVRLHELAIASPAGTLSGTAEAALGPRPTLRATLIGDRIDLARLRLPPKPVVTRPTPAGPAPPAPAGPAPTAPVIADAKLPFSALRPIDADLTLRLGEAAFGAQSLRGIEVHAVLTGGALSINGHGSFAATPVELAAIADSRPAAPTIAVALNAPSLPLAALLSAFGQPAVATGTMTVAANLRGAGQTLHAVAASLDGFARASMSGGTIQSKALERALGPAMSRINPLGLLGGAETEIRCLALRATAAHGVATLAPLLLSSALITVDGGGTIDLGAGTLDLHLQPQGRVAGIAVAVPMTVRGGLRDPRVAVTDAAAARELGAALGFLARRGQSELPPPGPSCAEALAAARS